MPRGGYVCTREPRASASRARGRARRLRQLEGGADHDPAEAALRRRRAHTAEDRAADRAPRRGRRAASRSPRSTAATCSSRSSTRTARRLPADHAEPERRAACDRPERTQARSRPRGQRRPEGRHGPKAVSAYTRGEAPVPAVPLPDRLARRAAPRLEGVARPRRRVEAGPRRPRRLHGAHRHERQGTSAVRLLRPRHAGRSRPAGPDGLEDVGMQVPAPHLARIPVDRGLLDRAVPQAANAVVAETGTEQRECGEQRERDYRIPPKQDRELGCHSEVHLLPLEPEVLERLGCTAVQHRRATLVSPPRRQVALGDPRGSTMRRRGQLRERVLGLGERRSRPRRAGPARAAPARARAGRCRPRRACPRARR